MAAQTISRMAAIFSANVSGFKNEMKQGEQSTKSFHSVIKGLKGSFGRGSTLFEIGHLLEGRGAFIGIHIVLGQLNEMSAKAAELATQFRAGKIDARGMVDELARGIPILGTIYSIGRNIHDAFSGDSVKEFIEKLKEQNEQIERMKQLNEARKELSKDTNTLEAQRLLQDSPKWKFLVDGMREMAEASEKYGQRAAKELENLQKQIMDVDKTDITGLSAQLESAKEAAAAGPQTVSGGEGGRGVTLGNQADLDAEVARLSARIDFINRQQQSIRDQEKYNVTLAESIAKEKMLREAATEFLHVGKEAVEPLVEGLKKYSEWADKVLERQQEVNHRIADMRKEIEQVNMTRGQKAADDLIREGGGARENEIRDLGKRMDAAEAEKRVLEMRKEIEQFSMTRAEKEADNLRRQGAPSKVIQDAQTAAEMLDQLEKGKREYEEMLHKNEHRKAVEFKAPTAIEQGTEGAANFIAEAAAREAGDNQQRLMLIGQKVGNDYLKQIVDNTKDLASFGLQTARL